MNTNKKTKLNGFMCFALDFQQRMSKNNGPINYKKAATLAAPHWEQLTDDEKGEWKEKALKTQSSEVAIEGMPSKKAERKKLNCLMQSIDSVEALRVKAQQEYETMVDEIKTMVTDAGDLRELDEKVFYFISASSFYQSNDDIYPAELAMSKFSLKEGVFDDLHIRINPGQLPVGSALEVQEKSIKCHKLPVPPYCDGETDYIEILKKMVKFLHPMDRLPVFFTNGNTRDDLVPYTGTCKIVKKIFYEAEEDGVMADIKIYPIDELFYIMQRVTTILMNRQNNSDLRCFPSISFAAAKFRNISYEYLTNGCEFHNEIEAPQNCCLSKVRIYGYIFAQWCSNKKHYPIQEGKHYPNGFSSVDA